MSGGNRQSVKRWLAYWGHQKTEEDLAVYVEVLIGLVNEYGKGPVTLLMSRVKDAEAYRTYAPSPRQFTDYVRESLAADRTAHEGRRTLTEKYRQHLFWRNVASCMSTEDLLHWSMALHADQITASAQEVFSHPTPRGDCGTIPAEFMVKKSDGELVPPNTWRLCHRLLGEAVIEHGEAGALFRCSERAKGSTPILIHLDGIRRRLEEVCETLSELNRAGDWGCDEGDEMLSAIKAKMDAIDAPDFPVTQGATDGGQT